MSNPVTRQHRERAYELCVGVPYNAEQCSVFTRLWVEDGIDGGPPMYDEEQKTARALADLDAELSCNTPRTP
jgi:hypothetical protein